MPSLIMGDALAALRLLPSNRFHLCVTDPPYFIEGLGTEWNSDKVLEAQTKARVRGQGRSGLPVGMKFDPRQGKRFQDFMRKVSDEIYRVLVPGGFFISFSQARLYHRLAMAVEDAGFEVRDMLAWQYEGQPKAFSQDHFVRKMNIPANDKAEIIASMGGRKTPQLKPQMEPMVLAQKPREGTFVENWKKWGTGLVDVRQTLDSKFPGNIMQVNKPTKAEKGEGNFHPTVKPVALISHLIKLFSTPGQVVIDPFLGSGSHGVAALQTGREFVGVERDRRYFEIAAIRMPDSSMLTVAPVMALAA